MSLLLITVAACLLSIHQALEICAHTQSGFHVILTPTEISVTSGRALCNSQGWEYAIVSGADWLQASEIINNCTYRSVGIWSYDGNGIQGDYCQYMQASGAFVMGLTDQECAQAGSMPLLCREGELNPVVETKEGAVNIPPVSMDFTSKQQDFTVCEYSELGMHLLFGPYSYTEAQGVCQANNWQLARFNSSFLPALKRIWSQCSPLDATAWIDSVDGISSGVCRFVYNQGPDALWLVVSEGDHPCTMATAMIICVESALI